jgi:3'-5' exoribonuclease
MQIKEIIENVKVELEDFNFKSKLQLMEMKVSHTPKGSFYIKMTLRDITGSLSNFQKCINNEDQLTEFKNSLTKGDILVIEGTYHIDSDIISITQVEIEKEFDLNNFMITPDINSDEFFSRIEEIIEKMIDIWLKQLLEAIFADEEIKQRFVNCPSAVKYHHAYQYGTLEHTVGMLTAFKNYYIDFYDREGTTVDVDLVNTGIILQDIGKIYEYIIHNGIPLYVEKFGLIGHSVLGSELVAKKIQTIPDFPEDLELKIKHIILSHHGRKEWGAPIEPAFPEARVVHALDLLDARLKSIKKL